MQNLSIQINVGSELYLKNPDSTELGQKIISCSILLIDKLGFESFTFKKLSIKINSPESSIYRYFENKHTLLVYLTSWYWSWTEYKILLATINVEMSVKKLEKAIHVLTKPDLVDQTISYIDEVVLNRIIIAESAKAFHTKDVDEENKKGSFEAYKNMVNRVAEMVLEINPQFKYPRMLVSTVVEGAHQQRYFSKHLPNLTDVKKGEDSITKFYSQLVFNLIMQI